jgi:crotonobetainyl-CoA:carnitine CoA-transferase CaiB-like acyl-CoA transferase
MDNPELACDELFKNRVARRQNNDALKALALADDAEWRALCHVIRNAGFADDPRFKTATLQKRSEMLLDENITAWTKNAIAGDDPASART